MAILPVKWYDDSMEGVPQMALGYGDTVNILDAVIGQAGFNVKNITNITRVDSEVTVTCAGHGFKVNQVVEISGVVPVDYNGQWRPTWADTNSFKFNLPSGLTPSNGSTYGTVKTPGLGFEIYKTGTNKRVYRSTNPLSNRPVLRVDNSLDPLWNSAWQIFSKVTIAEDAADIDTLQGFRAPYDPLLPDANEKHSGSGSTQKSGWFRWFQTWPTERYSDAYPFNNTSRVPGNKRWLIIGDDKSFYFFVTFGSNLWLSYAFSEFISCKAGDTKNCILAACDNYVDADASTYIYSSIGYSTSSNQFGLRLLGDYTGLSQNVSFALSSFNPKMRNYISGFTADATAMISFPDRVSNTMMITPVYILEDGRDVQNATNSIRGKMPGLFYCPQNINMNNRDIVTGVNGYPDKKFMVVNSNPGLINSVYTSKILFDIEGPWT